MYIFIGLAIFAGLYYILGGNISEYIFSPTGNKDIERGADNAGLTETVATNLNIPWEVVFLPDRSMLVTQRSGELLRVGDGELNSTTIEGVEHVGEGGLLGIALHPEFEANSYLYIYLTSRSDSGLINRVERYSIDDQFQSLSDKKVIIDNIPGASYHDGGRIAFGPDGLLYITTGDAGNESDAQNKDSLAGKILRLTDEGGVPESNPFGTAVFSWGHRNPQGITWDDQGRMWATEHGRSGVKSGLDEINMIEKGKNYGWPIIQGDEVNEGMVSPVINSGPDVTWAPAGVAYYDGSLFFAGLRGESLYEAEVGVNGNISQLKAHLEGSFGRLRAVALGPDGYLYISTSNRDGRGDKVPEDDRIIRVNPDKLIAND